jgi:hypothetical protein
LKILATDAGAQRTGMWLGPDINLPVLMKWLRLEQFEAGATLILQSLFL